MREVLCPIGTTFRLVLAWLAAMAISVVCIGLPVKVPARLTVEPGLTGGLTLRELIFTHLVHQCGSQIVAELCDAHGLKSNYAILANGRNAIQLGGLDLYVNDGSTVVITTMVAGG